MIKIVKEEKNTIHIMFLQPLSIVLQNLMDIESKCIFDLRVMYIMEGNTLNYSIIGDFINKYIVPYQYEIFTCINKQIIKELKLDI